MDRTAEQTHDDDGLTQAATVARDLVERLAGSVEFHGRSGPTASALRDAIDALQRLSVTVTAEQDEVDRNVDTVPVMFLDVSDLLGYFEHNRLPTGIQRVQAELIAAIMSVDGSREARLCCFVAERDRWVEVDSGRFIQACSLSRSGGDPLEARWVSAIQDLRADNLRSSELVFPSRAMLVNVGSSWWLPNYFLAVRQAKIASDVLYVPLIYDLIPALTPEYCAPELVGEFIGWLIGVLDHADFYLVISQATRRDLIAFAGKLGRMIEPDRVGVVALDADFRSVERDPLPSTRRFSEPFVLFVSTLEARKNQLGALDAWAKLVARYGATRVPRLVLVGKRGFKSDLILSRLETNADLRERVTILSGVQDVELQSLYRDCLFTIYPSFYEGWGLPVTESLSYGKIPLVADNSSLPEAGGTLALYYRTGSVAEMTTKLESLIFDADYRSKHERMIRSGFKSRSWEQVGGYALDYIRRWIATPLSRWQPPIVETESYYPMTRLHSTQVWPGMGSAEQFRSGFGWFTIENGGCWTKSGGGELVLNIPRGRAKRLGLELICPEGPVAIYRVELIGHPHVATGRITSGVPKWVFLDIPTVEEGDPLRVHLSMDVTSHLSNGWNGDPRNLGVGLRGFYVFGDRSTSRIDFLEAVALGGLSDRDVYRDRLLDSETP